MNYLLDTCTFLWLIAGSKDLSKTAREIITNPDHDIYLSAVSCWEIAVKYSLKKLPLPQDPAHYIPRQREQHGIEFLPLSEEASLHVHLLPVLHQDPFDRMLIAQALVDGATLLTPDEIILKYPVKTIW